MSNGEEIVVAGTIAFLLVILVMAVLMGLNQPPKNVETSLEDLVREYIKEIANPSPDYRYRVVLRARLAAKIGMEDPEVSLRRWHKGK